MAEQRNPLREWRGNRTPCTAAYLLHLSQGDYLTLESHPKELCINSDLISLITQITGIPLEVLVDFLTGTRTKEMAQ